MVSTDYWTAWGEELAAALETADVDVSPQDGYEALARSGLVDTVERSGVERLTDAQRSALRAELAAILECAVPADVIETAIERTAWRLPTASTASEKSPDVLEHPALGRLEWSQQERRYMGTTNLGRDQPVVLALDPFSNVVPGHEPDHLDDPRALAELCAARLAWVRAHIDAVSSYAAAQLIAEHNDGDWCEGHPIGEAEFQRRITPTDVAIDEEGRTDVFYDDGDLFWGHAIVVHLERDGGPVYAEFFG